MTDHLAAGRVRNAEIAIQEEVAQAPSREFGIVRFDVRKFADDRVLIHLKPPPFFPRDRDNRRRPIFWQRGSARSKLNCAMRKSRQPRCTAANAVGQCRESAEAAGANPKFGLSDCPRVNPEAALPGRQAPLMAAS
jgi:hypothetical protein